MLFFLSVALQPTATTNTTNSTTYLPEWFFAFAAIISSVAVILEIYKGISSIIKVPDLNVKLTKEIFFRITNSGETLFANAILIARKGLVEIKDVRFEMTKVKTQGAESEKKYSITPSSFGQKTLSEPTAGHCFYTQSPIDFIDNHNPRRVVYLNIFEHYANQIRQEYEEFTKNLNSLIDNGRNLGIDLSDTSIGKVSSILHDISALVSTTVLKIFTLIQLEPGNYSLKIIVIYTPNLWWCRGDKKSESQISFTVSDTFRQSMETGLKKWLDQEAANYTQKKYEHFLYPEYAPLDIKEL